MPEINIDFSNFPIEIVRLIYSNCIATNPMDKILTIREIKRTYYKMLLNNELVRV